MVYYVYIYIELFLMIFINLVNLLVFDKIYIYNIKII